jgi:phospholipid transport system substrate-binding protein
MVPITVSYFTKHDGRSRGRGIADAAIYSLSIIVTFTLLGLVTSALFGAAGIRDFAANPWVNILLAGIDSRRAEFRKDPTGLYKLVAETLLPNFDTPYAAQRVLGVHWRNASSEQKDRFVKAFYESLLYTYGDAMIDFTGDRLKVFPTKVDPTADKATVRTQIKRSNGTPVDVYYTMRKVDGAWKAWDVVIDGISYVKSYREDYGAEVQQKGLDAVIARLEAKAAAAKAGKGKAT